MKLKFYKFIFFLLLIFPAVSFAQEINCVNPSLNCYANNKIFFLYNTTGWAVGDNGLIIGYKNDAWYSISHDETTEDLNDVFFLNENLGWAVGANGTVLKIENGVVTLEETGTDTDLNSVFFTDENNGWVAGKNNVILKYENGQWLSSKTSEGLNPLNDIFMVDNTNGWAVGGAGEIYHYDGSDWTKISSPTTKVLYSIQFKDNLGYIVGANGTVLKFNDATISWDVLSTGLSVSLFDISIVAPNDVWVSGQYGSLINYNGSSWTGESSSGPWFNSLYMWPNGQGWVSAAGDPEIYKVTNGVETVSNSFASEDFSSVSLLDENNGWLIANTGQLYRMQNGNWSKFSSSLPSWASWKVVNALKDNLAFAFGNGLIYKFNGTTWAQESLPFQSAINYVRLLASSFPDENTGFAVGFNGAFLNYLNGSWTKISVENEPTTKFYGVYAQNASTVWIGGEAGKLIKYSDGVFTPISTPTTSTIVKVYFSDDETGYVATGSEIYEIKNGEWTEIPNSAQILISDMAILDDNPLYLIGAPFFNGGADGVIGKFEDQTWTRAEGEYFEGRNLSDIELTAAGTGYIVGSDGLILKVNDGTVTSIDSRVLIGSETNSTYVVSPNPSSDKIKLFKGDKPLIGQQIQVYGANGKLYLNTYYNPSAGLSIEELPQGLYMIRINQENGFVKVVKK